MDIFNIFHLESARRLPNLPAEHPCARVHGHSFQVEVHLSGPLDETLGWVTDFAEVEVAWAPVKAALDHRYLNDVPGLDNPTSERLAIWIWDRLKPMLPGLAKIIIRETASSGCVYEGERA
ncbi:MAG: 6-carboxytetrahydropterin synthase QueD [Hydrogenophilaceae bacterium CG1_02_62_390]|nr:6-carboxytetrahydropterin synthase QueD [Betaproteobacteria bacterium]OIO78768.1 MAG: 6-carboxytetrahydropterin synthase QueD [Hydrogenophilaceae bacterium CG1_02_62_390]PIW37610.1 MAG: 6-carboxytetrahydropterin synthase QueD [Hydrogenophilales bacterium CG15_BIG_FIL_POST_REV_8_21_14_020_62_31]PIW71810.1 MAG: 6-carboxytetrahydropterin synthase QueD [Hydrogenophilales bacterium CG12_big_fil_rev_8_21_14_0_65_61_21]PIX01785.1 MAG: 6-carboxytetrahydropterin synthase QueD [Hydrogenophilales bacte